MVRSRSQLGTIFYWYNLNYMNKKSDFKEKTISGKVYYKWNISIIHHVFPYKLLCYRQWVNTEDEIIKNYKYTTTTYIVFTLFIFPSEKL